MQGPVAKIVAVIIITVTGLSLAFGDTSGGFRKMVAILIGTLAAVLALGLRLWIAGLVFWILGHGIAVWLAKRDPAFVEVAASHLKQQVVFGLSVAFAATSFFLSFFSFGGGALVQ